MPRNKDIESASNDDSPQVDEAAAESHNADSYSPATVVEPAKTKIVRIMGKNYEVPLDYVFDPNKRDKGEAKPSEEA